MKKALWIPLLILALLLFVFTGCSSTSDSTETPPDATTGDQAGDTTGDSKSTGDTQEDVTLTAWYYFEEGTAEWYQAWADAVNETYPWITVELEELPYDSGPEKFTVACATNTTPDLYFDGFSRISPAVYGDLCLDVTDVVTEHQDVFLGEIKDGVVDGKNFYIPLQDGGGYAITVNMTLAEELGVTDMLPEDWTQWSYDDYLEICRAAKAADPSIYPTALYAGSSSADAAYYNLFIANGVELVNEDNTAAFNTPEALEVLEFLKTIIDEELCAGGPATTVAEDIFEYWSAGRLLFCMPTAFSNAASFYANMEAGNSAVFDFKLLAAPTSAGDYSPDCVTWGTYGVCAFKNNGNDEAIKLALGVMLEDPTYQNGIVNAIGKMSLLNNTTINYPTEELTEIMEQGAEYSANYARSDFGILESWWTDFRETFYPQLQDFYVGNIDAQTMLDTWEAGANGVLGAQ